MNPIKMTRRLTATFAGAALLFSAAGAAHATTGASGDPIPCTTAECQGLWWDGTGFPFDPGLEYEAPVNHLTASGTAKTEVQALAKAFDRATTQCPAGMKITDVDTVYNSDTDKYTVTVDYTCAS